jgi:hypothetical protein
MFEQMINAEKWYSAEIRRMEEAGFKKQADGSYVSPDGNTTVSS